VCGGREWAGVIKKKYLMPLDRGIFSTKKLQKFGYSFQANFALVERARGWSGG
jgi:hypothetical protein